MSQLISNASILVQSLGWAIFHSVWQGALIFTCLKLTLYFLPRSDARTRYRLSYASLLILFIWFGINFLQEWERLQAITVTITESGVRPDDYKVFLVKTFPQSSDINSFQARSKALLEHYSPLLALVYMIGLMFFVARFTINLCQIHTFHKRGVEIPGPQLLEKLENLKRVTGIDLKVKLLFTHYLKTPVVFGAIRPVILLPFAMASQLSPDQLEAILIHELAHIKRNDYLLNIFQTIIETILFFNPFTWLISATIRREREHCCDDLVLSHTSMPLPYAKALATLESYRLDAGSPALAATGNSNQLFNRIKRIMEMKNDRINYSQLIIPVVIVAAIAVSLVWLTPSFAQSNKQEEEKGKATSATTSNGKITIVDDNGKKTVYKNMHELPAEAKEQIRKALKESGVAIETANDAIKVADDVLKQVDVAAITADVNKALREIDWNQINKEVALATKEVDREKLGQDVNAAIREVNWKQIDEEVQNALNEAGIELKDPQLREEIKTKIKDAQNEARKGVDEARRDLEEARIEMANQKSRRGRNENELPIPPHPPAAPMPPAEPTAPNPPIPPIPPIAPSTSGFENMLKEMETDGLIDRSKGFEVEKKGKTLYINGAAQFDYVANKYSKYLKGDEVRIKGRNKNLSIQISN